MTPLDLVRARLAARDGNPRGSGYKLTARCPAHDDRHASLSVGLGSDGRVLVHCHAGCPADAVLEALGLAWGNLYPDDAGNGQREILETYPYTDECGELLFEVVRYAPKDFRQRRPDGAGGWEWRLGDTRRVLYRLPAVIAAVQRGETVHITEGERDVHALERLGKCATTNPGGAGKWRSEYSEALRGAKVAIIGDRDEPGRKHAAEVAASLDGVAAAVKVVEPPAAKDVAEHVRRGGKLAELVKVSSVELRAPPTGGESDKRVIVAESFATVRAERTRWLWEGRIPLRAPTLLVGREKTGKSTFTNELAARLSRGELAGEFAGTPTDTLIVSYEDSARSTIKPRLMAANADLRRVHRPTAKHRGLRDLVSLPDDLDRIVELVRETGARLLVVDPFSAALGAEVNSHRDQDVRRALAPLTQLAEDADLAVLLLAHFNKAQGGDSLSRVLGSRGITAAVRSVLAFGRPPDAEDGSPDRVLAHPACNVAREAPSVSCRLESRVVEDEVGNIETSRLVILGDCDVSADALLATRSEEERTDREIAAEWLTAELADGGWQESRDVRAQAKAAGITERTLQRALSYAGVEVRREGFPSRTEWRLPVAPTPSGATVAPQGWRDNENGCVEPKAGDPAPQSRQVSDSGTTEENQPLPGSDFAVPSAEAKTEGSAPSGTLVHSTLERYGSGS